MYHLDYHCENCGTTFTKAFRHGERAPDRLECARCGCRARKVFLIDEERERLRFRPEPYRPRVPPYQPWEPPPWPRPKHPHPGWWSAG